MSARILNYSLILSALLLYSVACFGTSLSEMSRSDQFREMKRAYQTKFNLPGSTAAGGDVTDEQQFQKCGLGTVLELQALEERFGKLTGYSEVLVRPDLPSTFDSPSGHFKIHYTTEPGAHQIDMSYGDQNANSVPDYAEIVARIADSCWAHHIDELGYVEPVDDSPYGGGDSRYDIYVHDVGTLIYGATTPEVKVLGNIVKATSWLEVDTHYELYNSYYRDHPIEALQVTIAHEFFHSIQFAYDYQEQFIEQDCQNCDQRIYWMEMSAVWMEEETYDNVNDYYSYLEFYLNTLHVAPYYTEDPDLDFSQLAIYGAGLFPIFISEMYGKEVIRTAWEICGQVPFGNFFSGAIQGALDQETGGAVDLEDAWAEYSRWLFFTGTRARPGRYFEEAANYEMIPDNLGSLQRPYIRYYQIYPITSQQSADFAFNLSELGMSFVVFRTGTLDNALSINFIGVVSTDPPTEWRVSIIGYDRFNANGVFRPDPVLYRNRDLIQVTDLESITDVLMIPTIVNPELHRAGNTYRFTVADTSITIDENVVSFGNTKFKVAEADENPFLVIFELEAASDVDFSVYNVAGEKVYQSSTEQVSAGERHPLTWTGVNDDNEEVASGVYIVQARYGGQLLHQKILVIR